MSLEDAFWKAFRGIARRRGLTISELVETINTDRKEGNLSSAIRLFVLEQYQDQIGAVASVGNYPVRNLRSVTAG